MDTVKNLLGEQGSSSSSEVPIEHLEYEYIGDCAKMKELEKILKILRSGKEGYYPDLIKFCEDRIAVFEPNNRILRKEQPPASKYDLGSDEWAKVNADIKDWTSDISQSEEALNTQGDQKIPPVRKTATIDTSGKKQQDDSEVWGKPSKDKIKSQDFRAWDKYDAEKEARKVDGSDDKGQRLKDAASEISATRSARKTPACINVEGMSDREREVVANREKDKGNEAFKTSDFDEAVTYYSRSISVIPSAPAYNNRALARIKLGLFKEAAVDCGKVLELEPANIKAYLRRGNARKSLLEFAAARQDLQKVLGIEPNNKQAKDLLADLDAKEAKHKKEQEKREKEKASSADDKKKTSSPPADAEKPKGGRRLIIQEVEGSDSEEEEWQDAKQDVTNDHKTTTTKSETPRENGDAGGAKLLNGVGGDSVQHKDNGKNAEEKFMPAESAQDSQVPKKGGDNKAAEKVVGDSPEVIRNIPLEENQPSENGSTDAVDGGCVSRPARDKKESAVDETQQNILNSSSENASQESKTSQPPSANTENGTKDAVTVETVPKETPVITTPPAPKIDRPLAPVVVALKDQALEFYRAGNYSDARDKFTQAIERLLPDKEDYSSALASLHSNRAACSTKTGDTKACIEDCGASLELNPYNAKVLIRRGAAYEAREKYRLAYLDFQQSMSFDPMNKVASEACSRLVRLLRDEDGPKWREKLPSRPSLPSLPNRPPILTTMAPSNATTPTNTSTTKSTMTTMTVGQESEVKGQTTVKPEVTTTKAAEEKKKAEPTLTKEERFQKLKDEGNSFFKKGAHTEAVKCYTSCIETDPTQVASYTNRALCYLKLNQFTKAETDCSLALALDTNNIKALYRRALARKGLKEYKKSAKDLTDLLKADTLNKDAKKELDLVKDLWRKELTAAMGESTKSAKKGKAEKKPTRIQIEESDTDSNEEKDNGAPVRPNQKSTSKAGKSSKGEKTSSKDSQESEKQSKQASGKKAARTISTKSNAVPKLTKVTAYEFMQAWMSLKGTRNLAGYAELIKQVPPKELPKVLSNKLDGDMLGLILRATSEHLVEKDVASSYAILCNLMKVERFNTLVLFLNGKDKKSLRKALDYLESVKSEAYSTEDVKKLRQNYAL